MLSASSLPVTGGNGSFVTSKYGGRPPTETDWASLAAGAAAIVSSRATVATQVRSAGIEGPNERRAENPLFVSRRRSS